MHPDSEKLLSAIKKDYVVIAKPRVRHVYAFIALALVLGIGIGIGYVISGGEDFQSSSASVGICPELVTVEWSSSPTGPFSGSGPTCEAAITAAIEACKADLAAPYVPPPGSEDLGTSIMCAQACQRNIACAGGTFQSFSKDGGCGSGRCSEEPDAGGSYSATAQGHAALSIICKCTPKLGNLIFEEEENLDEGLWKQLDGPLPQDPGPAPIPR